MNGILAGICFWVNLVAKPFDVQENWGPPHSTDIYECAISAVDQQNQEKPKA